MRQLPPKVFLSHMSKDIMEEQTKVFMLSVLLEMVSAVNVLILHSHTNHGKGFFKFCDLRRLSDELRGCCSLCANVRSLYHPSEQPSHLMLC